MSSVILGTDVETGQVVRLGDIERRSGLYLSGRMGMGKSALGVNIALQDIANGHGVFFLDPHGDAVIDLLRRGDADTLQKSAYLLDVRDDEYSFGINLLRCENVANLSARMDAYARAYNVFFKLWEEQWGVWLQLILQNVLHAFIENQGYTLADVPMFLNPRNENFRNHIIDNITHDPAVADFWRFEFLSGLRGEQNQRERVEAALTRINTLLTHPYVRHIVGQAKTTIDFGKLLSENKVILLKLSANLPEDVKKFIGTILLSEFVFALRARPEGERNQFCIFVDEFHNFASSDHMATMVTEGRKFGVASTFLHVERFGQLAHNQKLLGATQAIVNKGLFQQTVSDAEEFAPEFASDSPTETKQERQLVLSQEPIEDILKGHTSPVIQRFAAEYLRSLLERLEDNRDAMERERILRQTSIDHAQASRTVETHMVQVGRYQRPHTVYINPSADVANENAKLLELIESTQKLREAIRSLNTFLICIMKGEIYKGHEAFAGFLMEFLPNFFSISWSFYLYIALEYGDTQKARAIAFDFAKQHGLFVPEIKAVEQEIQTKHRQIINEKIALIEQKFEQYKKKLYDVHNYLSLFRKQNLLRSLKKRLIIKSSLFDPTYLDDFLYMYMIFLEYPNIKDMLSPFFTERFRQPWHNTPADSVKSGIESFIKKLDSFYKENANLHNYIAENRRAKKKWFRSSKEKEGLNPSAYKYYYERNRYQDSVLSGAIHFLKQYGEGAVVAFALWKTIEDPTHWNNSLSFDLSVDVDKIYPIPPEPPEVYTMVWEMKKDFPEYFVNSSFDEFNTLQIPTLEGQHPFYIAYILDALSIGINLIRVDDKVFGKYFWRGDGQTPCLLKWLSHVHNLRNSVTPISYHLGKRDDVQDFKRQLETRGDMKKFVELVLRISRGIMGENSFLINYICAHVCDLMKHGQEIADITFPLPSFIEEPELKNFVTAIVLAVIEKDLVSSNKINKIFDKVDKQRAVEISNILNAKELIPMPPDMLRQCVLTPMETEVVKNVCLSELNGHPGLTAVKDFEEFCKLLARPENHIMIPGTQFIETQVNTYTAQEMANQMAQQLVKLPRFQAYTKFVDESQGKQIVRTHRIETPPLSKVLNLNGEKLAIANGHKLSKKREDIDAEIRQRQARWQGGSGPPRGKERE